MSVSVLFELTFRSHIIQYIKDFPTELKHSDLGDLRVLLINSEW